MKINEKFESYFITTGCDNLASKEKYSTGKKDDGGFYLILTARWKIAYDHYASSALKGKGGGTGES